MSRVHSAMVDLGAPLAVELLAQLPDQLLLGPAEPLVVNRHREHALFVPAVPLDLVGAAPLAAEALRMKRMAFIRPPPGAARRNR